MDYRDTALEMIEEGMVDAHYMLIACLKYMSQDDVKDMLTINEYLADWEAENADQ